MRRTFCIEHMDTKRVPVSELSSEAIVARYPPSTHVVRVQSHRAGARFVQYGKTSEILGVLKGRGVLMSGEQSTLLSPGVTVSGVGRESTLIVGAEEDLVVIAVWAWSVVMCEHEKARDDRQREADEDEA